jgi:tRNA G10  N-methylase Trm11
MGYSALGSDIDQRMIDYTSANLDWLAQMNDKIWEVGRGFQLGDATSHQWRNSEFITRSGEVIDAKLVPATINAVACEAYLGKPFTGTPPPDVLAKTVSEVELIISKFLKNIHPQLAPGTHLCIAVPAWQVRPNQFRHLPLIDSLEKMGYNRTRFEHVRDEQLLYYREDQIVARELLVLQTR